MLSGIFKNGKLDFGNKERTEKARRFAMRNNGERFWLDTMLPTDSIGQRKFYHSAVLRLWVYLDGNDFRDSATLDEYHEWAKIEFNGIGKTINGKTHKIGGSTKGKLNKGYVDRVIDKLEEQYGIDRKKLLDHKHYKNFRDTIFINGEFENYIEYLLFLGWLELPEYYKK